MILKAGAQKSIGEPNTGSYKAIFFFWPLRALADIKHLKVNYQNIFYNYNLPLHRPQVTPATNHRLIYQTEIGFQTVALTASW